MPRARTTTRRRRTPAKAQWLKELEKSGAKPKRNYKELKLHKAVADFLERAWPEDLPWTHFPAGERRDPRTAAKLKRMGLKPGWPDFIFVLPNGQFAGLELKAPDGERSDEQTALHGTFERLRCGIATANSLEEVERHLTRWLSHFEGYELRASCLPQKA